MYKLSKNKRYLLKFTLSPAPIEAKLCEVLTRDCKIKYCLIEVPYLQGVEFNENQCAGSSSGFGICGNQGVW